MLLQQIGIVPAQVVSPDIDETPARQELPRPYAVRMALDKARAVSPDTARAVLPDTARAASSPQTHLVLAADTVVAAGRRILGKAETADEVRACMNLLSGRRHRVMTAVALIAPDGRIHQRLVESIVTFNRLTPEQIERYVATGEGIGKAGGYAINGFAAGFIRFLSGSYSSVVGLPLFETAQLLRAHGWKIP